MKQKLPSQPMSVNKLGLGVAIGIGIGAASVWHLTILH